MFWLIYVYIIFILNEYRVRSVRYLVCKTLSVLKHSSKFMWKLAINKKEAVSIKTKQLLWMNDPERIRTVDLRRDRAAL